MKRLFFRPNAECRAAIFEIDEKRWNERRVE
jgi:hypothetical protein